MKLYNIFNFKKYVFNLKKYKELINVDEYALSTFRGGSGKLLSSEKKLIEYKVVRAYRLYQANIGNIWGKIFFIRIKKYDKKYGIELYPNASLGKGLVIGHWGRIVVNGDAIIGKQLMITHGVTIGRDIRGKRKGVPTIGNKVCIRANSTVVGNIVIGDDVLIAPNTFVNFDVPSHSIVIGNPAKIIHRDNATDGHVGKLNDE